MLDHKVLLELKAPKAPKALKGILEHKVHRVLLVPKV